MSIEFRHYNGVEDYKRIDDFLIKHYQPENRDGNWIEPIWEYMHFHPIAACSTNRTTSLLMLNRWLRTRTTGGWDLAKPVCWRASGAAGCRERQSHTSGRTRSFTRRSASKKPITVSAG